MRSITQRPLRFVSLGLRAALVALAAGVLAFHPTPHAAQADAVDVGSNPVQIVFAFPQHDNPSQNPSTWAHINLAKQADLVCTALPQQACSQVKAIAGSDLFSKPLAQRFNDLWTTTKDKSGKTMIQESCDEAKQQVQQQISSNTGQSAYNINCNLATSGTVSAAMGTQTERYETPDCLAGSTSPTCSYTVPTLYLSYYLSNNQIDFTVTQPNLCTANVGTVIGNILTGGAGCIENALPDPAFKVTFDAEVDVPIGIPSEPCSLTAGQATASIHNANISGTNVTGDLAQFAAGVEGTIDPDHNAFPAAEQSLDDQIQPVSASLSGDLSGMEQGCGYAVNQGFTQFSVVPDPINGLTFVITHPLDKEALSYSDPTTYTPPSGPSLIHPSITAAPTTVPANGTVAVSGSFFPGSNATQIQLNWADAGDEQFALKESDIQWGTPGNLKTVTQQRSPQDEDQGGQFTATNLKPNTKYEFMVRDCDNVTCSLWSDPLYVTTAGSNTNQVTIYLDKVGQVNALGTADPDSSGSSSQAVTIPAATSAGTHSLIAVGADNQQADPVQITVLGANQITSPELDVLSGNERVTLLMGTGTYTAEGSYFTPGGKVGLYFDSASGKPLATATVAADGTFQAKFTAPMYGQKLLAVETVNGQTVQVTADVTVEAPPQ